MKPTFGLVPYTGIVPIETVIDHVGPMTRTVADCALMLEVRRPMTRTVADCALMLEVRKPMTRTVADCALMLEVRRPMTRTARTDYALMPTQERLPCRLFSSTGLHVKIVASPQDNRFCI